MKFPNAYLRLIDKRQFVEDETPPTNTFSAIQSKLESLNREGFVFRGQSNALWPIVSSAQREYVARLKMGATGEYIDFLKAGLAWAKQEDLFMPKCQDFSGRSLYDHEIWGWLQHYQYFTPFIDFTRDYRVALYMAALFDSSTNRDPYGHFSIYAFNGNYLSSANECIKLEKYIEDNKSVLTLCGNNEEQMFSFANWHNCGFCLIHKNGTLKPWDWTLARDRIASQNGLFVYFNRPDVSLEEYFSEQNGMNEGKDGEGCMLHKMKCIDVPNDMIPLVQAYCNHEGITGDYLGLSDQRIDNCLKCIRARFQWNQPTHERGKMEQACQNPERWNEYFEWEASENLGASCLAQTMRGSHHDYKFGRR